MQLSDKTIVQPDVIAFCNRDSKEYLKRLYGAPDFVIEVLSPSTRSKDMLLKTAKYQDAGVKELWLVDPGRKLIWVYDFLAFDQCGGGRALNNYLTSVAGWQVL